jgi:hypothetical protein
MISSISNRRLGPFPTSGSRCAPWARTPPAACRYVWPVKIPGPGAVYQAARRRRRFTQRTSPVGPVFEHKALPLADHAHPLKAFDRRRSCRRRLHSTRRTDQPLQRAIIRLLPVLNTLLQLARPLSARVAFPQASFRPVYVTEYSWGGKSYPSLSFLLESQRCHPRG